MSQKDGPISAARGRALAPTPNNAAVPGKSDEPGCGCAPSSNNKPGDVHASKSRRRSCLQGRRRSCLQEPTAGCDVPSVAGTNRVTATAANELARTRMKHAGDRPKRGSPAPSEQQPRRPRQRHSVAAGADSCRRRRCIEKHAAKCAGGRSGNGVAAPQPSSCTSSIPNSGVQPTAAKPTLPRQQQHAESTPPRSVAGPEP